MAADNVLPLAIIETGAGLVIRAICGAEAAVIITRQAYAGSTGVRTDASAGAVVRMMVHVKACRTCRALNEIGLDGY